MCILNEHSKWWFLGNKESLYRWRQSAMRQVHRVSLQVVHSRSVGNKHSVKDFLSRDQCWCSGRVKGKGREAFLPALNWKLTRLIGEAALRMEWSRSGAHGTAEWGSGPFSPWSLWTGQPRAWLEVAEQRHNPRVKWCSTRENSPSQFPARAPALQDINILYFSPFFSRFLSFVCGTVMELAQALFYFDTITRPVLNSLSPLEAYGVFIVPMDFYWWTIVFKITSPKPIWKIISKLSLSKF